MRLIGRVFLSTVTIPMVEQPRETQRYTNQARGYLTSSRSRNQGVEMHKSNQVMRQFRCTQHILLPSSELDDLRKVDLRGRLKEDWPTFHKQYIEIWQCSYDYLPTCELFLISELETSLDYMDWFKHNDKSYLLPASKKRRQRHRRRPR
ncbi:hypothetical protein PVK06_002647 [Gossypium arboreum]|uniref:Uncharacterized protein n=1 Tax=Gossypium arboreum TaxID=29729 RepID=A0ABR0R594_GOSAR|nr:hypothetical protein PVK06_002647 [Gossypium arboreum]